jgi:hypothetical protein
MFCALRRANIDRAAIVNAITKQRDAPYIRGLSVCRIAQDEAHKVSSDQSHKNSC